MRWSCGLAEGKPGNFYRWIPTDQELEFAITALTPGMPFEFIVLAFRLTKATGIPRALAIIERHRHIAEPLAIENAATITVEDGWNMLACVRRRWRKRHIEVVPHWSALALAERSRDHTGKELAAMLSCGRATIYRWRKSKFHPLTLQRLDP